MVAIQNGRKSFLAFCEKACCLGIRRSFVYWKWTPAFWKDVRLSKRDGFISFSHLYSRAWNLGVHGKEISYIFVYMIVLFKDWLIPQTGRLVKERDTLLCTPCLRFEKPKNEQIVKFPAHFCPPRTIICRTGYSNLYRRNVLLLMAQEDIIP